MPESLHLGNAIAILGEPARVGNQIATVSHERGVGAGVVAYGPPKLLGPEQWFLWDCAGVFAEFEKFQAVVLNAWERAVRSKAPSGEQLGGALGLLREVNNNLCCLAVEESAAPSSQRIVAMVNICARHRDDFGHWEG
jgi:hypothetical protein